MMQTTGASSGSDEIVGDAASLQRQQHGAPPRCKSSIQNCHCERSEAISSELAKRREIASSHCSSRASHRQPSRPRQCRERRAEARQQRGRVAGDMHDSCCGSLAPATIARSRRARSHSVARAAAAPRWRGRPRAARRPPPSGPASRQRAGQTRRCGRPGRAASAAPRPARRPPPPPAAARRKAQRDRVTHAHSSGSEQAQLA